MDNIYFDELIIKAMGKATSRALDLAMQLNSNNFNTFDLEPKQYSVQLIENKLTKPVRGANKDGFDPDSIDIADDKLRFIEMPALEIRVRKNKIEIDKVKQARRKERDVDRNL